MARLLHLAFATLMLIGPAGSRREQEHPGYPERNTVQSAFSRLRNFLAQFQVLVGAARFELATPSPPD